MQNQPTPRQTAQAAIGSEDEKTQKARMLISLLGADFTRSATHPFFRRLSQTAIGKNAETQSGQPADISGALTDLLAALKDTGAAKPQRARPQPPAPRAPMSKPSQPLKSPPIPPVMQDPLEHQHPAIIARELKTMPHAEKTAFIKGLSGRMARQVAVYSKELGPKR